MEKQLTDLRARVEALEPGSEDKLSMVVFSGDLDKLLAALIIATGTCAMGMKSKVFFTFWATAALRDPQKSVRGKNFMSRMFGFMLPKGTGKVKLSQMNMGGMGTAMLKNLMKKKNVASLEEMIQMAAQLGVEFCICDMSMDLMGMKHEEFIDYPHLEFCGVASFLAEARSSKIQLFIS
jgi:peroxiredoxin family protein